MGALAGLRSRSGPRLPGAPLQAGHEGPNTPGTSCPRPSFDMKKFNPVLKDARHNRAAKRVGRHPAVQGQAAESNVRAMPNLRYGSRYLALAAGIAAVLAGPLSAPALAQNGDDSALRREVRDLKAEIEALRRQVRTLRTALQSGGGSGSARKLSVAQNEIPPTVAARFEVRMGQLELALRKLTGRVEDLSFKIRKVQKEAKRAENDFEYRLSQLEKGGAAARSAARVNRPAAPTTAPARRSRPAADSGAEDRRARSRGDDDRNRGGDNGGATGNVLPSGPPAVQYRYAFRLMRRRETDQAIAAFREFVAKNPRSRLAGNAYHWMGRTLFDKGQFKDAARAFAAGYQKFPRHARAAENLLFLGVALSRIGQKDLACKSFDELRARYASAAPDLRRRAAKERRRLACR